MNMDKKPKMCIRERGSRPLSSLFYFFVGTMLYGLSSVVQADIFSSSFHLQNLMQLEKHLMDQINDYVDNMEIKLKQIKSYLSESDRSAAFEENTINLNDEIVGNPLQAFQLIKRLTVNFNELHDVMLTNQWGNPPGDPLVTTLSLTDIEKLIDYYDYMMPDQEDLDGAKSALIRLTDTYQLNITDLAAGRMKGAADNAPMSAEDCLVLAIRSMSHDYLSQAIGWSKESLARFDENDHDVTVDFNEITHFHEMAKEMEAELLAANSKDVKLTGAHNPSAPAFPRFQRRNNKNYRRYQALCRGEKLMTPAQEKDLYCYVTDSNNPWLFIQPVKVEVKSLSPSIVIYHELMTATESEQIRTLAEPMLKRAIVIDPEARTSQTTWLTGKHEIVNRLNRRVEAITGLSTDMVKGHCENMQVANYGMGGHFDLHCDFMFRPSEEPDSVGRQALNYNDRIATLMFYGGATVFPTLGVRLTPTKLSAAFWYNLKKNGEVIEDTQHAGCPVLMGEKWIANYWMGEIGQTFRRKCSLNPEE